MAYCLDAHDCQRVIAKILCIIQLSVATYKFSVVLYSTIIQLYYLQVLHVPLYLRVGTAVLVQIWVLFVPRTYLQLVNYSCIVYY